MADKLTLRHIAKTFEVEGGRVPVLQPVFLDVAEGEFVTIVGPSGCGKSTLFNIVAGLLPPDPGGSLLVDGRPVATTLGRIAYMPQRDLLFPWRTVLDNAVIGLEIQGMPRREARRRALDVIGQFGLAEFGEYYPFALSGGMKQRVALLRTFLFESDIMLLDEPFGALDALTRAHLQDSVMAIHQKLRNTVLMITHDVDEAVLLSDRIVMMTNGPAARIGEVLDVPLARPRRRLEVASNPTYLKCRQRVLEFLYERHRFIEAA